ncbi:hypothetical protein MXD59_13120 [Frankia sp. Ag45/Mut15]|uniref:Uncharacterized protein n=1 Tax=Frankia umida TaxID=573489 RepID=A0ABT0JYT3_9ACTN|nr:hypothetical protein [Frankia umida]MCK9876707.1 hypothetical protein [Frankia umida]
MTGEFAHEVLRRYGFGRVVPIDRYLLPITLVIIAMSAIPVLREYRSGRRAARPRG